MKFPRNARIFRGQLDAAPFAAVFFSLVIFLLLGSLIYTPGVHIQLPVADGLPGTEKRPVMVAIDSSGSLYFENHLVDEKELGTKLKNAVKRSPEPLALIVQADKAVRYESMLRLAMLAQQAGITEAVLATLPRPLSGSGLPQQP